MGEHDQDRVRTSTGSGSRVETVNKTRGRPGIETLFSGRCATETHPLNLGAETNKMSNMTKHFTQVLRNIKSRP